MLVLSVLVSAAEGTAKTGLEFPFKSGDRVMWAGSSSTRIGTWCRTMEFLLRTRHPEIQLSFDRETTGGGTFATGTKEISLWLEATKPTLVFFNYGGNDAKAGEKAIPTFKSNMGTCIEAVKASGARVIVITHQAGDSRMAAAKDLALRTLYAETMIDVCKQKGWAVLDTHHPLAELQKGGLMLNSDFTINRDKIHLTDSAYVAWGYYMYDLLNAPPAESSAEISAASGKVVAAENCKISDVQKGRGWMTFVRNDVLLPILPPAPVPSGNALKNSASFAQTYPAAQLEFIQKHGGELPLRQFVPLEKHSRYMLKVTGLEDGDYAIFCNDKPIAAVSAKNLEAGVNLNGLLLDTGAAAPWNDIATAIWNGKDLGKIGKTAFKFSIRKQ